MFWEVFYMMDMGTAFFQRVFVDAHKTIDNAG